MDETFKGRVTACRIGGAAFASTASWLLCSWMFYPMDPESFAVPIGLVGLLSGWGAGKIAMRRGDRE
jgi:hypothetical protein